MAQEATQDDDEARAFLHCTGKAQKEYGQIDLIRYDILFCSKTGNSY